MIHTNYAQAVTATGRLSSNKPNLQNIPIKTELGRKTRRAFVARDSESYILAADYSQIELRIIADFSGDTEMIKAFKEGKDEVWKLWRSYNGVTPKQWSVWPFSSTKGWGEKSVYNI